MVGSCLSVGGAVPSDGGGGIGDCTDEPSPDRFLGMATGMAGESGGEPDLSWMEGRVGDGGRLANELVVGVLGVLDGLGPGSTGRTGKFLNTAASLRVSRDGSFEIAGEVLERAPPLLPALALVAPVGMYGITSHPLASSSSSIEGKCCENSVK